MDFFLFAEDSASPDVNRWRLLRNGIAIDDDALSIIQASKNLFRILNNLISFRINSCTVRNNNFVICLSLGEI